MFEKLAQKVIQMSFRELIRLSVRLRLFVWHFVRLSPSAETEIIQNHCVILVLGLFGRMYVQTLEGNFASVAQGQFDILDMRYRRVSVCDTVVVV